VIHTTPRDAMLADTLVLAARASRPDRRLRDADGPARRRSPSASGGSPTG
jgi:hypothetical protein